MNDAGSTANPSDSELLRKSNLLAQVNRYFYLRKAFRQKMAKKIAAQK